MHLVGFITKKFVTMHGHMNEKKKNIKKKLVNLMLLMDTTVHEYAKYRAPR